MQMCHRGFLLIFADVDKELIASERQVSLGHFQLLYSAPEAILGTDSFVETTSCLSSSVS